MLWGGGRCGAPEAGAAPALVPSWRWPRAGLERRNNLSRGWEAAAEPRSGWAQDSVLSRSQTLPRSFIKRGRREEASLDIKLCPSRRHTVSWRSRVPGELAAKPGPGPASAHPPATDLPPSSPPTKTQRHRRWCRSQPGSGWSWNQSQLSAPWDSLKNLPFSSILSSSSPAAAPASLLPNIFRVAVPLLPPR